MRDDQSQVATGFRYGFGAALGVSAASVMLSLASLALWWLVFGIDWKTKSTGGRWSYEQPTPDWNPPRVEGAGGKSAAERFGWTKKTTGAE